MLRAASFVSRMPTALRCQTAAVVARPPNSRAPRALLPWVLLTSSLARPLSSPAKDHPGQGPLPPAPAPTSIKGPGLPTATYMNMSEKEYFDVNRPLRFLVAFDLSEASVRALKHAVQLMNKARGDVIEVVSCPIISLMPSAFNEITPSISIEQIRELQDRAERSLEPAKAYLNERIPGMFVINVLAPAVDAREALLSRIERADESERADLVIIGQRGGSRLISILLGSVATHLVHHSPVPVLVVR